MLTSSSTWHNSDPLESTTQPGNPFRKTHINIVPPTYLDLQSRKCKTGFLVKILYALFVCPIFANYEAFIHPLTIPSVHNEQYKWQLHYVISLWLTQTILGPKCVLWVCSEIPAVHVLTSKIVITEVVVLRSFITYI